MKHHYQKSSWGRQGLFSFHFNIAFHYQKKVRTGTQCKNLESGADTEVIQGNCFTGLPLRACSTHLFYIFLKKKTNTLFFVLHTNHSYHFLFSSHSLHLHPSAAIHSPETARHISPRKDQGPPHSIQTEQDIHPKRMGTKIQHKRQGQIWCHCQWPRSMLQPYNCHPNSQGLVWTYAGPFCVWLELVSSH